MSVVMLGIKRGLFSNEAGVGASATAAGSAGVSHPVKQGLVQVLSVFIDTVVICSATAFLLLCSGVAPSADMAGMAYVQAAMNNVFGTAGVVFITVALILFAFTTLLGNYYFAETGMAYLCGKTPVKGVRITQRVIAIVIVLIGSVASLGIRVGYRRCSDGTDGSHQRTNYLPDCQAGAPLPGRLPGTETGWEESGL